MQSQWCSTATTTGTYLMCCSVLQRDAECESYDMLIDAVAVVQYCNNYRQQLQVHIQRVAACCSVLQRVAACYSVLQRVAERELFDNGSTCMARWCRDETTTGINSGCCTIVSPQDTATSRNALQHTATLYNTVQHSAAHCNRPTQKSARYSMYCRQSPTMSMC